MNCVPSIKTVYMMKETLSGLKFIIHVGLHLFNDSSLGMHTEYIIWYINKKKILKGDILFFFATAQSSWMSDKSTNKAPSSVKTDTKAAASVHPYSMPNRTTSRTGPWCLRSDIVIPI